MNPEQPEEDFKERQNSWGTPELFLAGRHVSLQSLKEKRIQNRYLGKNITPYPSPVEFWVSDVTHVTDKSGYEGIMKSEEFKPGKEEFSWWSLKINENEIREAEQRYMERNDVLEPFLKKFTTSPAFKSESRYGNYCFTFPLTDLIKWYKEQNCGGKEPVLRVHETVIYKQKIMYTVLIHSPEDNKRFGKYPLLENSECVNYQDGKIVWQAQAICGTHSYEFISGTAIKINTEYPEYYVWDQDFKERQNSWGTPELFLAGRHVSLQSLKEKRIQNRYLGKNITPYPSPVEFWVSDVTHVTDKSGYKGIMKSEAFKPGKEFSWWSLKINENEILEAEQRYMERNDVLEPFLKKFTTSPAFKPESRFGNYRFTFPLTDLIKWYKEQNCGGKEPVLRVHETVIYKQKIMYTVLIHSPEDNKRFGKYPLLENSMGGDTADDIKGGLLQFLFTRTSSERCKAGSLQVLYETRWNIRSFPEHYITGQHVSLQRLKENPQELMWRYISKEIPPYPNPVEFCVSDVTHVTEESGFDGILKSEQIRPPESEFSWWDLKINKEEIISAEERYVESHFQKNNKCCMSKAISGEVHHITSVPTREISLWQLSLYISPHGADEIVQRTELWRKRASSQNV
ncbi:hypothetical protein HF521_021795 [Silurus meridionalis]|uniref:Uncharacterized protein n=1 Tax=Silurus meridionalis TaxID=175797 RepID=A0A8T0BF55_SILME|nr:hypothetical protein HF521_021795 [Silurus meridionalis]